MRMRELVSGSAVKSRSSDLTRGASRRRCHAHAPRIFLAAVVVALASLTATTAESATAPDSARVAMVRLAALGFDDIRVVTDSRKLVVQHVVVSAAGLQLPLTADGTFSSNLNSSSSPQERLVPWGEIESIDVRRGSNKLGPVVGGVIGLAVIYIADAEAHAIAFDSRPVSGAPVVIGLLGGATLGSLLARPGPWKTVYP